MTHYEVLGVAPDASTAEIRQAYLGLARRHHPDYFAAAGLVERAAAERRMRAVNAAWTVLGDHDRRRAYDRSQGVAEPACPFRPFEPDDDFDPHDLPDRPYRARPGARLDRHRALTLAPVLLFAASVALFSVSLVVASFAMFVLSVATFVLSCAGFVVVPLLVMSEATRDEG